MTFAPAAANPRATAAPIPPLAPVRMTPRPSSPAPTLHVMSSLLGRPVSGAQHLLAAVTIHDLIADVDPEAGLRRWIEPAIAVLDRLGHQLVLHRVAERLHLDELEGRRAEAHRQAGRRHDRRRPAVGVG